MSERRDDEGVDVLPCWRLKTLLPVLVPASSVTSQQRCSSLIKAKLGRTEREARPEPPLRKQPPRVGAAIRQHWIFAQALQTCLSRSRLSKTRLPPQICVPPNGNTPAAEKRRRKRKKSWFNLFHPPPPPRHICDDGTKSAVAGRMHTARRAERIWRSALTTVGLKNFLCKLFGKDVVKKS